MTKHSDEHLQQIITRERNRRALGHCLLVEDVEESEELEETAKKTIAARYQIGTVGREGL